MRKFTRFKVTLLSFLCAMTVWADVPFTVTTITADGTFAEGTQWYTMQIGTSQLYITDNGTADKIVLNGHGTTELADSDLWCFVGNETDGYQIYNKQTGTTKVLASATTMTTLSGYGGTGGSTYPTLQAADNLPAGYVDRWDFAASDKISTLTNGQFVKLHGTEYAWNNFGNIGHLAFWAEGMDAGSTVNIECVEITGVIDLANGSFTASNANGTWHSTWSSSVIDGFRLNCGANNMVADNTDPNSLCIYSGQAGGCTITLSAPTGYIVEGYSFDFRLRSDNTNASVKINVGGTEYTCTAENQHIEVSGLEQVSANFTQSGNNKGVTYSNFKVKLRKDVAPALFSYTVFPTTGGSVPYRIPAIAQASNGDLIAVADYRYSKADIGSGNLDLRYRISHDNGQTWDDIQTLISYNYNGGGNLHTGYGDPCIVADRESNRVLVMSCSGNVMFPSATADHHQGIARFYSEDNGQTWSKPYDLSDSIYNMFKDSKIGAAKSMFVGSGKISQSRTIKVGDYYRIYCALLFKDINGTNKNYALYSDDFGETWSALGGIDVAPIPSGADEPKADELPDGSVLVSSRVNGGRYFNIFRYTDAAKGEGFWSTSTFSGSGNNGTASPGYTCNGEILTLPVTRKSDNKDMFLQLQSVPFGSGRVNVGIYYKELETLEDFNSGANIAKDWDGNYQISYTTSCYSTMVQLADSTIAFLFEENSVNSGYDIVYKNFSIEQITDSAYTLKPGVDATAIITAGMPTELATYESWKGTNVGNITEEGFNAIKDANEAYCTAPSEELYAAYNKAIAAAETVQLSAGIKYRLRNKLYPTKYLTMMSPNMKTMENDEANENQLISFIPTDNGTWKIHGEAANIFAGNPGANEGDLVTMFTTLETASEYEVLSSKEGHSALKCLTPANAGWPALHAKSDGRIVRWVTDADASRWFIEPTDIATGIESLPTVEAEESNEVYYDLSGRRVEEPKNGIFVTSRKRKVILK